MTFLPTTLDNLRQALVNEPSGQAAWNIIDEYYSFFRLREVEEELWLLTAATLTNDEIHDADKGMKRHNLIFFFEFTKMLAAAVHLLYLQRKEAGAQGAASASGS